MIYPTRKAALASLSILGRKTCRAIKCPLGSGWIIINR